MDRNRRIYIVFTRTDTVLSHLIRLFSGGPYTHVALSFERSLDRLYSFSRKKPNNPFVGRFMRESLREGVYARQAKLPGLVRELELSETKYRRLSELIDRFLSNRRRYKYHYLGLLGCLFGIETDSENRFVCSSFVYYALSECRICDLGIPVSLARPEHLLKIGGKTVYEGDLLRYRQIIKAERKFAAAALSKDPSGRPGRDGSRVKYGGTALIR